MITQVWNAAFEAIPADNDQISEGALRIRNLKRDIRERAEIDHDWDDLTDAGKHKRITYVDPLSVDPDTVQDQGYTYTKNVSGVVELHWKDEVGNVLQVTAAGKVPGAALANDTTFIDLARNAVFPSGTRMAFQQTAAPPGWTKDVSQNDKALRIVSGAVGSGGTTAFTTVFGSGKVTSPTTLTEGQIPSHTHPYSFTFGTASTTGNEVHLINLWMSDDADPVRENQGVDSSSAASRRATLSRTTSATGGGAGHDHALSLDLQYVDIIIATKD